MEERESKKSVQHKNLLIYLATICKNHIEFLEVFLYQPLTKAETLLMNKLLAQLRDMKLDIENLMNMEITPSEEKPGFDWKN